MKNSRRIHLKKALALPALLAIALGITACGEQQAPQSEYLLLSGQKINTQDFQGKVVFVNFWATSCTTCVAEMPHLVETWEKYKTKGYDTIAIAMQYDPPKYVNQFAQSRKLPFKVALDNTGKAAKDWGNIQLTPTSFLLDKKGQIVKRYIGQPNFSDLHKEIEKLLAA